MASFIAPIIQGITSLIGANSANSAAKTQAAAEQQVGALAQQTTDEANRGITAGVTGANKTLADTYTQDQALLQPYEQSGTSALAQLNGLTGSGGFQAPTAAQAGATPGEQFMLQQGELAQQRSAAAAGGVLGGGEAKALQNYTQGVASTGYQQAYNNALGTYQTNFGNLSNLANLGLSSTNTGVGSSNTLGTQTAGNTLQGSALQSGNLLQGLGVEANALTGAANARASGYVGTANAINSGLSGIATGVQQNGQLAQLQQILGNTNGGSGGAGTLTQQPYPPTAPATPPNATLPPSAFGYLNAP